MSDPIAEIQVGLIRTFQHSEIRNERPHVTDEELILDYGPAALPLAERLHHVIEEEIKKATALCPDCGVELRRGKIMGTPDGLVHISCTEAIDRWDRKS